MFLSLYIILFTVQLCCFNFVFPETPLLHTFVGFYYVNSCHKMIFEDHDFWHATVTLDDKTQMWLWEWEVTECEIRVKDTNIKEYRHKI